LDEASRHMEVLNRQLATVTQDLAQRDEVIARLKAYVAGFRADTCCLRELCIGVMLQASRRLGSCNIGCHDGCEMLHITSATST
jgi:hypothetical protein